jgi:hypothetical protein
MGSEYAIGAPGELAPPFFVVVNFFDIACDRVCAFVFKHRKGGTNESRRHGCDLPFNRVADG